MEETSDKKKDDEPKLHFQLQNVCQMMANQNGAWENGDPPSLSAAHILHKLHSLPVEGT